MTYDWSEQRWRFLPDEDADPEENFLAVLKRLHANGDRQALLAIRAWADEALDLATDRARFFAHEGGLETLQTTS
jgi:hypothetical protein